MRLVYDATGRKWFKYGEFGTTSYDFGIEYHDGKLEAVYVPDGRMVAEYTGGMITRYRAEYFHQDDLGDTRLVFSDFNLNGIVDLEEDDPATPLNELEITQAGAHRRRQRLWRSKSGSPGIYRREKPLLSVWHEPPGAVLRPP